MGNYFEENFSFGSILYILLFILGNYILYLLLNNQVSFGIFLMLIAFLFYLNNNVLVNVYNMKNSFNRFLENISVFLTFGISTLVFGYIYYKGNSYLFLIIVFYAVCLLLSLVRNISFSFENSIGWPVSLNGLFFPLFYFIYVYFFNDLQNTIFLFYYIIVGVLLVSSYNFLRKDNNNNKEEDVNFDDEKDTNDNQNLSAISKDNEPIELTKEILEDDLIYDDLSNKDETNNKANTSDQKDTNKIDNQEMDLENKEEELVEENKTQTKNIEEEKQQGIFSNKKVL